MCDLLSTVELRLTTNGHIDATQVKRDDGSCFYAEVNDARTIKSLLEGFKPLATLEVRVRQTYLRQIAG